MALISAGVTGGYYADCKPKAPSAYAQDDALAERLWTASERIVDPAARETSVLARSAPAARRGPWSRLGRRCGPLHVGTPLTHGAP